MSIEVWVMPNRRKTSRRMKSANERPEVRLINLAVPGDGHGHRGAADPNEFAIRYPSRVD